MKNKDKIITKINNKLNNLSESKLEEIGSYFENRHTDSSSTEHSPKTGKLQYKSELPVIKEEALVADEYGHTPLSTAIEEGNIRQVREMYGAEETLNDADLLRTIAVAMMNSNVQEEYNLSRDIFSTVYSEAKYQLKLMGEDINAVIDAYNLD